MRIRGVIRNLVISWAIHLIVLYRDSGARKIDILIYSSFYPIILIFTQFVIGDKFWAFLLYRPDEIHRLPKQLETAVKSRPEWLEPASRFTHSLFHSPSNFHIHLWGNVISLLVVISLLYMICKTINWESQFLFGFGILFIFSPIVVSYPYELLGSSVFAMGASSIVFSFIGFLAVSGFKYVEYYSRSSINPIHAVLAPVVTYIISQPPNPYNSLFLSLSVLISIPIGIDFVEKWSQLEFPGGDMLSTMGVSEVRRSAITWILLIAILFPSLDGIFLDNIGHQVGFYFGSLFTYGLFVLIPEIRENYWNKGLVEMDGM